MLSTNQAVDFVNQHKKVAIVGLSPNEERASYRVGNFLKERGFDIIPVNPGLHEEIIGLKNRRSLENIAEGEVEWIDVFLNPGRLMGIIDEVIRIKPKMVWCQIGVINEEFNKRLEAAGIDYITDVCPKIELVK